MRFETSLTMFKVRQIERYEHHDNSHVGDESFRDVVSEEEEIHADNDDNHHHYVEHSRQSRSHSPNILRAATAPLLVPTTNDGSSMLLPRCARRTL